MGEKIQDFSAEEIRRLMGTPEAKELAAMLKKMDSGTLSKAASLTGKGDVDQAKAMLQPILDDPRVKELLKRMGNKDG